MSHIAHSFMTTLQALQYCLGVRANATGRGGSNASYVRQGAEQAVVKVRAHGARSTACQPQSCAARARLLYVTAALRPAFHATSCVRLEGLSEGLAQSTVRLGTIYCVRMTRLRLPFQLQSGHR